MRIQVNLATRPFVELRPFFARLRLAMAALGVLAVGLMVWSHALQKKVDAAQAQMDDLRRRTVALQEEKLHNEQRMRQPGNAAVLDRAHFLNTLFLRKSFSWTAVMMDLENVLPAGVQVTSIEPAITADGDVIIRLRVSGERDRAVQLVRNLERSRRFRAPRLTGEAVQAREVAQGNGSAAAQARNTGAPPGVEFEILANYAPLPAGEAFPATKASVHRIGPAPVSSGFKHPSAVGPKPVRSGPYPPYGVVLKPYNQPQSNGTVPAPASGQTNRPAGQGGPR